MVPLFLSLELVRCQAGQTPWILSESGWSKSGRYCGPSFRKDLYKSQSGNTVVGKEQT